MVTKEIIDKQREYYLKGNTLSVDKRISIFKKN